MESRRVTRLDSSPSGNQLSTITNRSGFVKSTTVRDDRLARYANYTGNHTVF